MDFHILLSDAQYPSKSEKRRLDSSASCPTISSIPSNPERGRHLRSSSLKPTRIHTSKGDSHQLGPRLMTSPSQPIKPLFSNDPPQGLPGSMSAPSVQRRVLTTRKKQKTNSATYNVSERNRVGSKRRYATRSTHSVAPASSQSSLYSDDEEYYPDTQSSRTSTHSTARARYQNAVPSQSHSDSHSHLRKVLKLSTTLPLHRVPSIMDIFLDARSPSIDYDEEVFLEIAERSSWAIHRCDLRDYQFLDEHSLRVYWADQGKRARIWLGLGGGGNPSCPGSSAYTSACGPLTQLPDSSERSTAGWTDTDADADADTDTNSATAAKSL
ncbi:hypothetical protein K435DRAFT_5985 [Dendrothele bispora CBS 962.96]|uniref:Uncharacterized protein n=1 Tax=Dendrothele bispora (strain CBS 962.96) TaxID=1314807 RepID=A0A4S8MYT0_DENBC|nr:hypothetical protein K435DRAFT_5985 [Dendrothele bispora CBS 962.96]